MKTIVLKSLLACLALLSSCRHDDGSSYYGACYPSLSVRALDGNDSQIQDIAVYIYNADGKLVGSHTTQANTSFNIKNYIQYGSIKVVSWGNVMGSNAPHVLSAPTVGSSITDLSLTQLLSGQLFDGNMLSSSPSDIFQGIHDVSFEQTRSTIEANRDAATMVYINRAVASFILTINGIGKTFGDPDNDYKVLIRHPYSGLNYAGNPIGAPSVYMTDMVYDPVTDKLTSPINMALPSAEHGIIVEIYSGGKLVHTTKADKSENIITLYSNKLQNIMIDLVEDSNTTLIVSEWDDVVIFQGFE